MLEQFENCISLGVDCKLTTVMYRTGLHSFSAPFDWVYSKSFSSIIKLINDSFIDFLNKENLEEKYNYSVHDKKYDITFFHDFWRESYEEVKEKYNRRIKRFLEEIKRPTCFFRLLDNDKEEIEYINNNLNYIKKVIKKYNNNNEIVFLCCGKKNIKEAKNFCLNIKDRHELNNYQHKDHSYKILENKEFCEFIKNILPAETIEKNKKFYNNRFGTFVDLKNKDE